MKNMSIPLKLYLFLVYLVGLTALVIGIEALQANHWQYVFFFTLLGIIAESVGIKLDDNMAISVCYGILLAAIFVFKTPVVAIIGMFSMILYVDRHDNHVEHIFNTPFYKRLFNGCAYATALTLSMYVYNFFDKSVNDITILNLSIIGILASVICYIVFTVILYAFLVARIEKKPFFKILQSRRWFFLAFNILALSPLGIISALVFMNFGYFGMILFFGPLLLARHSYKLYIDTKKMYSDMIVALSSAVDAKDQYTNGHSYRVADYAIGIAKELGLSETQIEIVKTASILHDIGKIGIEDRILNKPGALESTEYSEIKKHPEIGARILEQVHNLSDVAHIIKFHHERFDGKGYPKGLKGDIVPYESYIIAVSDAFDAMTSDRPYRKAMSIEEAISIIKENAGKQFHPRVVEGFLQYIEAMSGQHMTIQACS